MRTGSKDIWQHAHSSCIAHVQHMPDMCTAYALHMCSAAHAAHALPSTAHVRSTGLSTGHHMLQHRGSTGIAQGATHVCNPCAQPMCAAHVAAHGLYTPNPQQPKAACALVHKPRTHMHTLSHSPSTWTTHSPAQHTHTHTPAHITTHWQHSPTHTPAHSSTC